MIGNTSVGKAYEIIKEKIICLEMAPGTAIHESALSDDLSLGRTPIREALKLLQAESLVSTVPNRGMFVANVSVTDLQQISEIRLEVEALSARLAAERALPSEIAEIEGYCAQADCMKDAEPRRAIRVDRQLHAAIARASHNQYLVSEVERFYNLSLRLWHLALARVQTADLNMAVHERLLNAFRARDAKLAEDLMREHIRSFQRSIRAAM